jgi:hypothetical protein
MVLALSSRQSYHVIPEGWIASLRVMLWSLSTHIHTTDGFQCSNNRGLAMNFGCGLMKKTEKLWGPDLFMRHYQVSQWVERKKEASAQLTILKKIERILQIFQKEGNMQRSNFSIPSCITLYYITNVEVTTLWWWYWSKQKPDTSSTHKLAEAEPRPDVSTPSFTL